MVSRAALLVALMAAASPAASQITSREIAETADISGIAASPDGKWIAYRIERPSTLTNRIDVDWYIVAADGQSAPRSLGRAGTAMWNDAGGIIPGEAKWSPDGKRLVIRALVDGRVALWASSADGSGFRPIGTREGDVETFAFGEDGTLVASEGPPRDLIARTEETERENGILVDGHTDLAQPLFRGALVNGRAASQRFVNDWFDRAPLLSAEPRKISARAPDGLTRLAREEEKALLAPQRDSLFLLTSDLPSDLRASLEAQGVCKTKVGCAAELPRLSWWHALDGGDAIVATHNADFRQRLQRWSQKSRRLTEMAASDGQLSGDRKYFTPCALAGDALFCVEAAAALPPRLVRIGKNGAKLIIDAPNSHPDHDGLLAETIVWQAGGSRASGVLIRPKFPGRLPLFITYYSCAGYLRGGVGDEWPLRALAAHGIASLCINAVPGNVDKAVRYDRALAAVESVTKLLSDKGIVDADRVGMGGLSFGSEVTMWTATRSNILKAISIASVQMEPAYYWFNARPGRETFDDNIEKTWGVRSPDETPDGWMRLSPALNIDKISAPVLMQFPEQEARLSIELVSRLATAHMGETHIFPYAPHIKVEPRQKLAAYERNLDWFRFWLKGEIDPDPSKAQQYQRWAKLNPALPSDSTARTQRSTSAISIRRK